MRNNSRFLRKLVLILFIVSGGLVAQPYGDKVEIPGLTSPVFTPGDIASVFDEADAAKSQTGWESLVKDLMIPHTALWENDLQAQMDAHVAAVYQNDYVHTQADYEDYLYKALLIQKQYAMANWELAADVEIEQQRERYVTALTDDQQRATFEESAETIEEQVARQTPVDTSTLEKDRRDWSQDFDGAIEDGLNQFQMAIGAVESGYQDFLAVLDAKDQEFETNRLQIESYEQQVRDGIQSSVTSMDAYLTGNGLFHQETCTTVGSGTKTTTSCATDMNTLNAAGLSLQTLITTLQTGLDQDQPLSVLAVTMNDYITQQQTQAVDTQADWAAVINGTDSYLPANVAGQGPASTGDPLIDAAIRARGSDPAALMAYAQAAGEPRAVTGIAAADIQGISSSYLGTASNNGTGEYYSNAGGGAFTYNYADWVTIMIPQGVCVPFWGCTTMWIPYTYTEDHTGNEQELRVTATYNWYDANADTNAQVWQGYVDDINPIVAHWTNNILPAIHNWEQQVADYTADHQQYLLDAAVQRDQAAVQREDANLELVRRRNIWTAAMEEEYRQGNLDWDQIERTQGALGTAKPKSATTAKPAVSGVTREYLEDLNTRKLQVATAGDANRPDFNAIQSVGAAFQQALGGATNITLAKTLSDNAFAERDKVIAATAAAIGRNSLEGLSEEQLRALAEKSAAQSGMSVDAVLTAMRQDAAAAQYSVEILADGTVKATRQMASGKALRKGGDGTSASDYEAEMIDQEVKVAPPPVIALSKTANLFTQWDHNAVATEYYNNQDANAERLNKYYTKFAATVERADEIKAENYKMYQGNMQSQMNQAQKAKERESQVNNFAQSIMGAVQGGASVTTAISQVATQTIQNSLHELIAKTTGLPVGFLGGLASGLPPDQAARQHLENEAYAAFEETVGIPGTAGLLRERLSEQQQARKERDANRGVQSLNFANQLRYNAAARGVANQALSVMSGEMFAQATGLPLDLISPIGAAGITSMDDIDQLADSAEQVRRGEISADAMKADYTRDFDRALKARLEETKKMELKEWDPADALSRTVGTLVSLPTGAMLTALRPNETSGTALAFRNVASNMARSAGLPEGFASGIASGMKLEEASKYHIESEINASIDREFGAAGASTYLREKMAEQAANRTKRDAQRGAGNLSVLNALRYNDAGRALMDTTLGMFTGATLTKATGIPVQGPLSAILPSSMDELTAMADDLAKVQNGQISPGEMSKNWDTRVGTELDELKLANDKLKNMRMAEASGSVTGGIGGAISPLMKSINTIFMGDNEPTAADQAFRAVLANTLKQTTGIQPAFIDGLIVHGESMEDAATRGIYENLLQQHNMLELEQKLKAAGQPGIEAKMRERIDAWNEQKDAQKAAQFKPEDAVLMGVPYLWRNAQYDATSAMVMQAAEIGAGIAIASTGVGAPAVIAYMSYMVAKQGYLGSLEGGTVGAVAGAASGLANAVIGLTPAAGSNVNISYSFEDGFGANLGYGANVGGGGVLGGSLSLAEGKGISGFGLNASLQQGTGTTQGGSLGMNWDLDGNFQGGSVKYLAGAGQYDGGAGLNFDQTGSYSGVVIEGGLNMEGRDGGIFKNTGYRAGAGLTLHKDGKTDIAITQGVNLGREGSGITGLNVSGTNTFSLDAKKKFSGVQQTVTSRGTLTSPAMAARTHANLIAARAEATDPAEIAAIDRWLADIEEQQRLQDVEGAQTKSDLKLAAALSDPNDAAKVAANAGKLTDAERKAYTLKAGLSEGGSRDDSLWDTLAGGVSDSMAWLGGRYSGADGYIDERGDWHTRTCFVASTPVLTKQGPLPIEQVKAGMYVLAYNEKTKEIGWYRVRETFVRTADAIHWLALDYGNSLGTTWSHRFYMARSADGGEIWKNAENMVIGDAVHTPETLMTNGVRSESLLRMASASDEAITAASVTGHTIETGRRTVYNFAVEEAHSYFVQVNGKWLLVHNDEYSNFSNTVPNPELRKAETITGEIAKMQVSGKRTGRTTANMKEYPFPWVGEMDEQYGPEKTKKFLEAYFSTKDAVGDIQDRIAWRETLGVAQAFYVYDELFGNGYDETTDALKTKRKEIVETVLKRGGVTDPFAVAGALKGLQDSGVASEARVVVIQAAATASVTAVGASTASKVNPYKYVSPKTPVGHSAKPLVIPPGTNKPGVVGGRSYSGHSFDRMQERGITPRVVENTIQNGSRVPGTQPGTFQHYDPVNNVTVITNKQTGNVITVRQGK